MTDLTPEERRDAALAEIIAEGLVVVGEPTPLADPATPHTVAAYAITVGDPTYRTRSRLDRVQAATQADVAGLIPWTPEPEPPVDETPAEDPPTDPEV